MSHGMFRSGVVKCFQLSGFNSHKRSCLQNWQCKLYRPLALVIPYAALRNINTSFLCREEKIRTKLADLMDTWSKESDILERPTKLCAQQSICSCFCAFYEGCISRKFVLRCLPCRSTYITSYKVLKCRPSAFEQASHTCTTQDVI